MLKNILTWVIIIVMFLLLFLVLGFARVVSFIDYVWFDVLQNSPILMVLAAAAVVGVLAIVVKVKLRH